MGDGLGTLVQDGAETYIITHDHRSRLVGDMHKVQFRNAEGEFLVELDLYAFYSLIRYRDPSLESQERRHFGGRSGYAPPTAPEGI